ncbi:hypothetical protein VTK26DRAFT_6439 [Humicola hyalothermophila]
MRSRLASLQAAPSLTQYTLRRPRHAVHPPPSTRQPHNTRTLANLAINNTFLRRNFTLLALKTTARFYRYDGPCVPISKHLIVKTGPFVHLTEAATIMFVAAKTSIPVPRVYCSFVHKNHAFILMERIQGQPVAKIWGRLSDTDRESILEHLRGMIKELKGSHTASGHGGRELRRWLLARLSHSSVTA